ncbi:MAG: glycosyltransferase family 4 protein [Nitrospira sp.]|nr:glycosyltransferase family 4 protein [Nitrospira sp.]
MSKYRVLLIVKHPVGGIRTYFRYVYKNFSPVRYHFTLLAPDVPEVQVLLEDLKDLDIEYVPVSRQANNKELFKLVSKIIRTHSFELIHSHGFTAGVCAVSGALTKRIPHLLTCHDVIGSGQLVGLKGYVMRLGLGGLLSMIDSIHCASNDARDNLLAHVPILKLKRKKVVAIPHGIESERFLNAERRDLRREFDLPPDTFLIGFLGRFMSLKGFRYLVDAFEQVRKMEGLPKKPLLLTFSQPDGFIREDQDYVKQKGLGESVLFLPFVSNVASTLKGLDIVAMPSLSEACGLLAMETLVAGIPLVGTNCIGLREVLQNTPAYVVPAKDSTALSEALAMEMRAPTMSRAKKFATEAANRFEVKRSVAEVEKLMLELIEG